MVELAVRLLLAGGLVLAAGVLGLQNFDAVWIVAAGFCAFSLFGYWLETKGRKNAGAAGLLAGADAAAIAALLASFGAIPHFGFLVLAPCAYAAARFGSLPSAMAPIATFVLLGADQWANKGAPPTPTVFGQALGVLGIGLLLNHRRIIVSVAKPVLPNEVEPLRAEEPEAYMELRESFRKLKDMYQDLERKSRRDRFAADLRLTIAADGNRFHRRLAAQLSRLSGAEGLSLYTMAEHSGTTVLRAVEGTVSDSVRQSVLHVNPQEAIALVRERSEEALRAVAGHDEAAFIRNVVLTHRGRVVGLVSLQGETAVRVTESAALIEEVAPIVGEILQEGAEREVLIHRLRRAELLYRLASAEAGSASRNGLAARVVDELGEATDLESIAIVWLDDEDVLTAATHGVPTRPFDGLSFAEGPGVKGWLNIGSPEIVASDVADDVRCRRVELGKSRIQSLAIFPVGLDARPEGILIATSPRTGAIDAETADALRLAAAELSQTLAQLAGKASGPSGLTSASEFRQTLGGAPEGCLVYIEPLRSDEWIQRCGRPAFELALRQYAHRLRTRLPAGGSLLRRNENDFVAYLPGFAESAGRSWANEATVTASLVEIPLPQQTRRTPLAVRAKVAQMDRESAENDALTAA